MTEANVATPETEQTDNLPAFRTLYDPELAFEKLALEAAYFSRGFRHVKDKTALVGVPHVIIAVTYREGYMTDMVGGQKLKQPIQGDYVSIEAVVADKGTLHMPQVRAMLSCDPDDLEVFPNEPIVYNDGGTGVRREMTHTFHRSGVIDVGGKLDDERRFDRPYTMWDNGQQNALTGLTHDANGIPFRYLAFRGLRKSVYDSPYGPAETFYFG